MGTTLCTAGGRQSLVTITICQQDPTVFETLRTVSCYEEIGIRTRDVGRDHPARAEIEPELHGDEDDREKNADQRNSQAHTIMQQVTER